MKAVEVSIHNFRSVCDATIKVDDCGILVGVNNAGKTTVIDAIRAFYGKGVKFDKNRDFPHTGAGDNETWVEIEFSPTEEEFENLKDEYKSENGTFRIRNYLFSEHKDSEGKKRSGPYAYIDGQLSDKRFYGFKNVAQGKFGDIIYIPAVSKVDDHTKLSGPSALRELVNSVLSRVMERSPAYQSLSKSFSEFEEAIKTETTEEGHSIETIESDISRELSDWGMGFKLTVNPVGVDDVVKGLIGHEIVDESLGITQPITSYGQGFQRKVIYTLIRVAAKYNDKQPVSKKKEFSPKLTWILFEEPEAFLHPTQISILNADLRALCEGDSTQVLLSTHSPLFATHSIRQIPSICRLHKSEEKTRAFQISENELDEILEVNQEHARLWADAGIRINVDDLRVDMEAVKYALWLDSKRCGAFFAEKVLLVEGPTETSLLTYMYDSGLLPACKGVFFLDTMGKYNIHRFMSLFEAFGIQHYVLYDGDEGRHEVIDSTIASTTNQFTGGVDTFDCDIERFLGITPLPMSEARRKPQHVMLNVIEEEVDLRALADKVSILVSA